MARLPGRMRARARPTRAAPSGRGAGRGRSARRGSGATTDASANGSRDGRPRPLRRRDRRGRRGRRDGRGSFRGGALGRDVGTHASLGGCFRSLLRLGPLERLELLPPRQEGVLLGLLGRHVRVTIRPAGRATRASSSRAGPVCAARASAPIPHHHAQRVTTNISATTLAHPRQMARLARRGPPRTRARRASVRRAWNDGGSDLAGACTPLAAPIPSPMPTLSTRARSLSSHRLRHDRACRQSQHPRFSPPSLAPSPFCR